MAKGIIYIMTTVVPGLIKIGKTKTENFKQRMYNLEHDGYRNVTALQRTFAIEVEDYDEKEKMLHRIFAKSQVSDTELFALDVNLAIQLLSSFDGKIIYPTKETKEDIFDEATEKTSSALIPDGVYKLRRNKKSDNKMVNATVEIIDGSWLLKKGSILGVNEDTGVNIKAKMFRIEMQIDENGLLLEDVELGECTPSFAGTVVMNQSSNGWDDWKNSDGKSISIYRNKKNNDEE